MAVSKKSNVTLALAGLPNSSTAALTAATMSLNMAYLPQKCLPKVPKPFFEKIR
jgi:hypothetical protein